MAPETYISIRRPQVEPVVATRNPTEQIESYTPYHKLHFRVLLKEGGADELR